MYPQTNNKHCQVVTMARGRGGKNGLLIGCVILLFVVFCSSCLFLVGSTDEKPIGHKHKTVYDDDDETGNGGYKPPHHQRPTPSPTHRPTPSPTDDACEDDGERNALTYDYVVVGQGMGGLSIDYFLSNALALI